MLSNHFGLLQLLTSSLSSSIIRVVTGSAITKSHTGQRHMVKKLKLLLADKHELFCKGLASVVERKSNIKVVATCRTELEAIESACKNQPDVILIDIELSESSGIDAMQSIHERLPKTSVIVLTHSEANGDLLSAIKAGARGYVLKDISVENLIKNITLVADGEVIVSPPMASRLLAEINFLEEHKSVAKAGGVSFLSKRQQAVLSLVAQGLTNGEIATRLFISEHTVKVHLRNIMGKFHAHTRQKAVALAREKGAIQDISLGD